MSPDTIRFPCPNCRTALTVPASMAGVRGPCPICSAEIQAPYPEPPASPVNPYVTVATPPPSPSFPPPAAAPSAVASVIPQRQEAPPPPAREQVGELPERPAVRPAPRGIPEPRAPKGIAVRHHTSDVPPRAGLPAAAGGNPLTGAARLVVPLLLILAAGTVVYMIIDANRRAGEVHRPEPPSQPAPAPGDGTPLPRIDPVPPRDLGTLPNPPGVAPVIPRPTPEPPAPAPLPPGPDPGEVSASLEATRLLEEFLATASLQERQPHLEPELPAAQFEGSILAGLLPPHEQIRPEPAIRNEAEGFIDFPFITTFRMPDSSNRELMIIVRKRAEAPPKILALPFFDLLDGRLARFAGEKVAAEPVEFRAVIEAIPRVFEHGIPGDEDKFTYKLSSSGTGPEILRAYASRKSALAEMLYTHDSPLRWGIRLPCTVTLQWNDKEDPENPYIELREIRSIGW